MRTAKRKILERTGGRGRGIGRDWGKESREGCFHLKNI